MKSIFLNTHLKFVTVTSKTNDINEFVVYIQVY